MFISHKLPTTVARSQVEVLFCNNLRVPVPVGLTRLVLPVRKYQVPGKKKPSTVINWMSVTLNDDRYYFNYGLKRIYTETNNIYRPRSLVHELPLHNIMS